MGKYWIWMAALLAALPVAAVQEDYSCGGATLRLDAEKGVWGSVGFAEEPLTMRGEGAPLWRLYFYDEATRKLNDGPLTLPDNPWQNPWHRGSRSVDSTGAKLVRKAFDAAQGLLTLEYHTDEADVTVQYRIGRDFVRWRGSFVNRSKLPVYEFSACEGLRFRLAEGGGVIIPDYTAGGVEYTAVGRLPWSMCDSWDGFLLTGGPKLLAFYNIQDPNRSYLPGNTELKGVAENGRVFTLESNTAVFAMPGESRSCTEQILLRTEDLRTFADRFVADNYPGIRKLRDKYPADVSDRLSRAYLAPTHGRLDRLAREVVKYPGHAIFHTPKMMHPVKPGVGVWDAFPNYFPPDPAVGTQPEYAAMIRAAVKHGHFFMPRNSFFYWVEGSDPDREYDLRKLAVVRVDGKVRTASWALPGYLVSPSNPKVMELLEEFFQTWTGMGANMYFTNVIGAIGPYGNRYDFTPGATPDRFYQAIHAMMKRHGSRLPLLSEGGGTWQMADQAGFCTAPNWNPDIPASPARRNPIRGAFRRYVPETALMLMHEYVKLYPHNAGVTDSSNSIGKLGYSLVHGYNLKFGLEFERAPDAYKLRWLRTVALLSDRVWSRIYGSRAERYRNDGRFARTDYSAGSGWYNLVSEPLAVEAHGVAMEIAPDGFGFLAADGKVVAGYLSGLFGRKLKRPELVVMVKESGRTLLYAPLAEREIELPLPDGRLIAVAPAPAAFAPEIPCVEVTADTVRKLNYPDSGAVAAGKLIGFDTMPEIPSATWNGRPFRPQTQWRAGEPLPAGFQLENGTAGPEGIRLSHRGGKLLIEAPGTDADGKFYLETVFRLNAPSAFGNEQSEHLLVSARRPERNIELRYNLYHNALAFLASAGYLSDLSAGESIMQPGKFYHVKAYFDGRRQVLEVNGKRYEKQLAGPLRSPGIRWQVGDHLDMTVSLLRLGGEKAIQAEPVTTVPGAGAPAEQTLWRMAKDSDVKGEFLPPDTVAFSAEPGRHNWCYLLGGVAASFRKAAEDGALEFTLDLTVPEGMSPAVTAQLENGALFRSVHFPKFSGSVREAVCRVPLESFSRAPWSPVAGDTFDIGRVSYLYIGLEGTPVQPGKGMVRVRKWSVLK